ncbi:DUF4902 domain-containing protein [Massilia sp. B-10]|nr:DUF4902 domain-containing protein [Massilia sp. B-10]UUZ56165.1 DUF4902 domain-containing protein [Massilia sp. H-1]
MSDTGYVYLSLAELENVVIVHLVSGVDEDAPEECPGGAVTTSITGYTEWVSQGSRIITIGWDWQMQSEREGVHLRRVGKPSSNVMLQSPPNHDLGPHATRALLEQFIDGIDWQPETLKYINVRYNA